MFALLLAASFTAGCDIGQARGNFFAGTPESFIEFVNKELAKSGQDAFDSAGYTSAPALDSKTIRTYTGSGSARLMIMLDSSGAMVSVRLGVSDQATYNGTLDAVRQLIARSSDSLDENTVRVIASDYEKYSGLRLTRLISLGDFGLNFCCEWIGDEYVLTLSNSSAKDTSWTRRTGDDKTAFSLPETWTGTASEPGNKSGLRIMSYESAEQVTLTILHAPLSPFFIERDYGVNVAGKEEEKLDLYFMKFLEASISQDLTSGRYLLERSTEKISYRDTTGLVAVYATGSDSDPDAQRSVKTVQFVMGDEEYIISLMRTGEFTVQDLEVLDVMLDSMAFD